MATRGETVDRSVLLEGVLLPVGLRRAPGDVRRGRWDGPARVAALIGAELNEGFDASGVERRSSRLVDAAIEVRTDDQFFEMARWRAAAAARRADVLARRGVNLLLCSERVDHAACDALTRRGVFVAELVPEEDIRSTLDACGGARPRRPRRTTRSPRATSSRRRCSQNSACPARPRPRCTFGRGERTRRWSEDRARRRARP